MAGGGDNGGQPFPGGSEGNGGTLLAIAALGAVSTVSGGGNGAGDGVLIVAVAPKAADIQGAGASAAASAAAAAHLRDNSVVLAETPVKGTRRGSAAAAMTTASDPREKQLQQQHHQDASDVNCAAAPMSGAERSKRSRAKKRRR